MIVAATVLAGPGSEDIIRDALLSAAPLVDRFIVLNSGGPEVARAVDEQLAGGAAQRVLEYHWPGSYGQARNDALEAARTADADWALTLDTDERLAFEAPTAALASGELDVISIADRDHGYSKPRYLRCRDGIEWVGKSHELLRGAREPYGIAPGAFWELPKTREQRQVVFRRFVAWVAEEPSVLKNLHWRRHYGDCLLGLEQFESAGEQYATVAALDDAGDDERAWCHYRLAELDLLRGDIERAAQRACLALAGYPWRIQEFGWILAHTHFVRGRDRAAALWAEFALAAPLEPCAGQRSPTWRRGCLELLAKLRPGPPG